MIRITYKHIAFLFIGFSLNCNEPLPVPKENTKRHGMDIEKDTVDYDPYLIEACKINDFNLFYDCNRLEESYLIKLSHDPFKDWIIITLLVKNNLIDSVIYARIRATSSIQKSNEYYKRFKAFFEVPHPITGVPIYCYYTTPKSVKWINKNVNNQISIFFTSQLWEQPTEDPNTFDLDPEIWKIKGRKNNKEKIWRRGAFQDSVYYTNIQNVLNLCKIQDYQFKGMKN